MAGDPPEHEPKPRPLNDPKRAVAAYLDERLPTADPGTEQEDPDRAEIRRSLVSAVTTLVGEEGVCAKADTQDGTPVLVAARGGILWLVSHVSGGEDEEQLGSVEAQRLGSLPSAEIVQTLPVRTRGRKTIELRHERLPGGSLSFDTARLRREAADELVGQLERIAA
jgi:hypothetical protein